MVVIDYPDNTSRYFFLHRFTLFGPFDPNCGAGVVQTELPLDGGDFYPRKGIFGENDIVHSSFHGNVSYFPILADCVPMSTIANPRHLRMPMRQSPGWVQATYGFACPEYGALVSYIPNSLSTLQAVRRTGKTWTMIRLMAKPGATQCYVYSYTITLDGWVSSSKVAVSEVYRSSKYPVATTLSFASDATCEQIFEHVSRVTTWSSPSTFNNQRDAYTTDPSMVLAPTRLKGNLDGFVNQLLGQQFPIPEVDFGTLAARAVKQKLCVDANLYEFMRDLPNMRYLIPALQNLKSLKGLSGEYLKAKYGVLPTVDDLRKVLRAFRARAPFLDRYGHSIFNSSNKATRLTETISFQLDQYIKVAINDEDDQFIQLLEEFDKWGLSFTFENVWDLVRYSFVIDWFVDVGSFLERVDQNLRLLRYKIPYVTMSRKRVIVGEVPPSTSVCVVGPIGWRYYHRWVSSRCPLPPLTLSTSPTVSNHWLEAGALIIQRAL